MRALGVLTRGRGSVIVMILKKDDYLGGPPTL